MLKSLKLTAFVVAALAVAPVVAQQAPATGQNPPPPPPSQQNQTNPGGPQATPQGQTPAQQNPAIPGGAQQAPAAPAPSTAGSPVAGQPAATAPTMPQVPPNAASPTPSETARSLPGGVGAKPTEQAVREADLLKALKDGQTIHGRVSIPDQRSANLIQPEGQAWRAFKTETLPKIGALFILGMIVALALFFAFRGRVKIEAGPSGVLIERFSAFERFTHWMTASSFIVLALTGLNVTFGRGLLLPLFGAEAFTAFSLFAKSVHNYVGFAFMIGLVLTFVVWVAHNIPSRLDVQWLMEFGGLLGKGKHPPARKFNAGQKIMFWTIIVGGSLLSFSGLHLLFPYQLGNGVTHIQFQSQIHGIVAMVMVAVIIAHIYIGTIGMEGAFDAMATGNVDLNWAKEHHSLWVEEVKSHRGGGAVPPRAVPAE